MLDWRVLSIVSTKQKERTCSAFFHQGSAARKTTPKQKAKRITSDGLTRCWTRTDAASSSEDDAPVLVLVLMLMLLLVLPPSS